MLVYVPRALVGCVSIRFCAVFLLLRKVVLAFNSHFQQKNVVQRRMVKAQANLLWSFLIPKIKVKTFELY